MQGVVKNMVENLARWELVLEAHDPEYLLEHSLQVIEEVCESCTNAAPCPGVVLLFSLSPSFSLAPLSTMISLPGQVASVEGHVRNGELTPRSRRRCLIYSIIVSIGRPFSHLARRSFHPDRAFEKVFSQF